MKIDKMKITKMKKKRIALLLAAGTIAAVTARTSAMVPEQVKIETGLRRRRDRRWTGLCARVQGHSVCRAAARRKPVAGAAAAAKWDGVRSADAFGAPCTAGAPLPGRGGAWRVHPAQAPRRACATAREPARSEDCLYAQRLDQRALAGDKRPVMVWIYGGGFTGGSGGMAVVRRREPRRQRPGHRHLQLPPRLARLLRASGAGERIGPQRLRATTG